MRKLNYKFLSLAVAFLALGACEEDDLGNSTGEIEAAMGELYVNAESTSSQVFKSIDEAMRRISNQDPLPYSIDNASFDVDPTDPTRYLLDYGQGTNTREKLVKGTISVSLTGTDYLVAGTSVSIGFDNYSENDKPISGDIIATNVTASGSAEAAFSLDVNNFSIQDDGEVDSEGNGGPKTMIVNSEKILTWTAGSATASDITDDKYTISNDPNGTGTSATYDNAQFTFDVDITTPLEIDNTCQYRLVSGVIELEIETTVTPNPLAFTDATIDFVASDGCNQIFTINLDNSETGTQIRDLSRIFNAF